MASHEELFGIAEKLTEAAQTIDASGYTQHLDALEKAANEVQRAFSGSWLGYHSRTYYRDLVAAPPGAHFNQNVGIGGGLWESGTGDWREYDAEYVKAHIYQLAGDTNLAPAFTGADKAKEIFNSLKSDIISILSGEIDERTDRFLESLKNELEELKPLSPSKIVQLWSPTGSILTRDMVAIGQGIEVPPHIETLAQVVAIRSSFGVCNKAADISRKAASHLERKGRRKKAVERIGTNVFIGHGRSDAWRQLKDFIQDRLHLPWDEFNRVPVAGVTNIARLSEMLDAAGLALLVMTAEDGMADGGVQARMNVVHEAGLFQGRLGFTKAIVLLEEECEEFSNIQGLGQIRFPRGNIKATFEEVREVLKREGLLGESE